MSATESALVAHQPAGPSRPQALVAAIPAAGDLTPTTAIAVGAAAATRLRVASKRELFRLALNERSDPEPFYSKLAESSMAEFPFPVRDRDVLDLGSGPGYYTGALARAGARVTAVDLNDENVHIAAKLDLAALRADATNLPFADGSFHGIFCSNMLEHVPDPTLVLDEIERLLRPGGWAWISWTNWYSPWGGHHITPFHYLGPRLGQRAYVKVTGHEPERNPVFAGLWPTYIGRVLADVRRRPGLRMLDAVPRYYPFLRWIVKVPGLREVATWNCLILVQKPKRPVAGGTS